MYFEQTEMELKDYIQGKKAGKEANCLERKALNDPFLQDAIDGFDAVAGNHSYSVKKLEEKLAGRIKSKEESSNNRLWIVGIAASIALVIGFGTLILFHNKPNDLVAVAESAIIIQEDESGYLSEEIDHDAMKRSSDINPIPSDKSPIIAEAKTSMQKKEPTFAAKEEIFADEENMFVAESVSEFKEAQKYISDANESASIESEPMPQNSLSRIKEEDTTFGKKEFEKYFEKNRSKNICSDETASATVHFYVNETGTPVNITVEKSSCNELQEELIRLLGNGPKWSSKNRNVKLDIRLK